MLNIMIWVLATHLEPQPAPMIIEQSPNYEGPTAMVFHLAGGILLVGALLLWVWSN